MRRKGGFLTVDLSPVSCLGRALDLTILGGLRKEEQAEFFKQVLLECAGATHIPEVCEILGSDAVIKFFDHFAGTTIEVPSREKIQQALRDTTIFFRMYQTKPGHKAELSRELAADYELKEHTVYLIYMRMKKRYEMHEEAAKEARCLLTGTKTQ
jgi:Mor family transcriptional regulator